MHDIIIENLRGLQHLFDPCSPYHVYIGRLFKNYSTAHPYTFPESILANPFPLRDESQRSEVLRLYWNRLSEECCIGAVCCQRTFQVTFELAGLRKLAEKEPLHLWCWCAPKICHGDVIREFLLSDRRFYERPS